MKTLLPTSFLTVLFTLTMALPASAEPERSAGAQAKAELAEACTRKSRRPITEEISGRCTEEEGKHYFVNLLPECNCRLEQDSEGHSVLRLQLPAEPAASVEDENLVAVPAVFKPDSANYSGLALIL